MYAYPRRRNVYVEKKQSQRLPISNVNLAVRNLQIVQAYSKKTGPTLSVRHCHNIARALLFASDCGPRLNTGAV